MNGLVASAADVAAAPPASGYYLLATTRAKIFKL